MSEIQEVRGELEACERTIERGLNTFIEVGLAIRQIRDNKLYKVDHETYEEYCRQRWGWSRRRSNQMVEAADTAGVVGTNVPVSNEAQARELSPLKKDPETMNRVWGGVVEEYGEKPAAKHVKKAVEQAKTAERIRSQLPPATRTVVEGIDPHDCNLPNEPKQLTHLLDASLKHGDERAAETAERVGNGEFKTTFDAYPEIKKEDPMAGRNFDLTEDQKTPRKIGEFFQWLKRRDKDAAAARVETAFDLDGHEETADDLIAQIEEQKAAYKKRREELQPVELRRVK